MHWIRDAISHHQIIGLMCAIAHWMRAPEHCTHTHTLRSKLTDPCDCWHPNTLLAALPCLIFGQMHKHKPEKFPIFRCAALLFRFELWASSAVTAMHWHSQYRRWWWWYSCHSMALLRVSTEKKNTSKQQTTNVLLTRHRTNKNKIIKWARMCIECVAFCVYKWPEQ